jgi:protein-L-isoaspartate O-methyltransferase
MPERSDFYDARYRTVSDDVRTAVRREVFGEDIGQASWLTVDEYRAFFAWLDLHADQHVLDVACGSGGPALFLARTVGCCVPAFRRRRGLSTSFTSSLRPFQAGYIGLTVGGVLSNVISLYSYVFLFRRSDDEHTCCALLLLVNVVGAADRHLV